MFTLFDRIAQRDLGSALEVLHKILLSRDTDPVQLFLYYTIVGGGLGAWMQFKGA